MCACVYAPSPKGGKASRPKLNSNFRAPKQVAHNQVSNSCFFKVVLQKTYLPGIEILALDDSYDQLAGSGLQLQNNDTCILME